MASGHHRRWGLGFGEIPCSMLRQTLRGRGGASWGLMQQGSRCCCRSSIHRHQPGSRAINRLIHGLHPRAQVPSTYSPARPLAQTGIPVALGVTGSDLSLSSPVRAGSGLDGAKRGLGVVTISWWLRPVAIGEHDGVALVGTEPPEAVLEGEKGRASL